MPLPVALPELPHGGDVDAAAQAWSCNPSDVLDLSTGLHPAGPPVWLGDWLHEHVHLAGRYPDGNGDPACSALAADFGLASENILICAGAQAAIEVIFQAVGWQTMAIRTPCYTEPIRCAERAGCTVLPFQHGGPAPDADVLWWTCPHNPTGQWDWTPGECSEGKGQSVPNHELAGKLTFLRDGRTCVLDESYMPFATRRRLGLLPGVVRIGSLTKTFGIPGLRLGYVIADSGLIARLRDWLSPWPASTIALYLLPKLLPDADRRDNRLVSARQRMMDMLHRAGWQYLSSQTSFVLAKPPETMPDFAAHRILVRMFPEWPELAGWVRLGFPGNAHEWQRLEAVLCP